MQAGRALKPKATSSSLIKDMNKTRFRSLDRMARDPRIVEIWDETADGLWAQLAPGYNFDGASCLHEWTVRALLRAWRTQISIGPTY